MSLRRTTPTETESFGMSDIAPLAAKAAGASARARIATARNCLFI
jgi:hypothetical protein